MLSLSIPMAWSLLLKSLKGKIMRRQSIIQRLSIWAALTLVVLTYGCSTTPKRMYAGEALPKEQVATIEGSKNLKFIYFIYGYWSHRKTVLIREVDGKPLLELTNKCEVLPGLHNVVVEVERSEKASSIYGGKHFHVIRKVPLQFNVIAGHKYRIKIEKDKYLMAVNTHSGEVVAKNPIYLSEDPFGDISTLQQNDDFRINSKANWLGGSCGFFEGSPPDNMRIRNLPVGIPGVLTTTDKQLSFVVWNGDKYMYMPLFEFGYDKITKTKVEKHGLAKKLVVISKTKDCYSFKLKKRDAIEIADFISKKIGPL